jgi:hypothetical protein
MAEKKSKLAEIKTKPTTVSVDDFIAKQDETKRQDSLVLLDMMKKITKEEPVLWGSSIIGFGNKRYKSPSGGREVDWFKIGFSPRKANLTVYIISVAGYEAEFKKLGKHKTGGGCIYINKLLDVDTKVLEQILTHAFKANNQ